MAVAGTLSFIPNPNYCHGLGTEVRPVALQVFLKFQNLPIQKKIVSLNANLTMEFPYITFFKIFSGLLAPHIRLFMNWS